jgi:uncharacterized protein (TIGR02284 family)
VRGYRSTADEVDDASLASELRILADRRRAATEELVRVATDAGFDVDPDFDGTAAGGLHRAWIKLEGTVAGDESLVTQAIAGEQHALENLHEALESGLGEPMAATVRAAAQDVEQALATLRRHTG